MGVPATHQHQVLYDSGRQVVVASQSPRCSQVARRAAGRRRRRWLCPGSGPIAQSEGHPSITETEALWIEADQRPGERTLTIGVPSFIVGPRQDGPIGLFLYWASHLYLAFLQAVSLTQEGHATHGISPGTACASSLHIIRLNRLIDDCCVHGNHVVEAAEAARHSCGAGAA